MSQWVSVSFEIDKSIYHLYKTDKGHKKFCCLEMSRLNGFFDSGKQSKTYIDSICAQVARKRSRSILNVEVCSILFISRTLLGIVFIVQQTGDVRERTFLRWNPEIRGAGVKDDFEALRGSSYFKYQVNTFFFIISSIILRRQRGFICSPIETTPKYCASR